MKFNFAMIAIVFAASLSTPAFAQDWDMQPDYSPTATATATANNVQPFNQSLSVSAPSPTEGGMQFDTSTITAFEVANTAATGSDYSVPPTTGTTSKQLVSTLPVCATHTLSRVRGPVAANGLPPCNLDGFVAMAGAKALLIYGEYNGTSSLNNDLKTYEPINSGIDGESAAGLTTGQGSN